MRGEPLLTVKQVAQRLGVRPETVRRWIAERRIKAVMPGGTKAGYRIEASELTRVLRADA